MIHQPAVEPDPAILPQPTQWSQTRRGNRLDCETGALLRQILVPLFCKAESWTELRASLRSRGFDLRFEGPRLILIEIAQGEKICSCRFLGHPLSVLSQRLGRIRVRPPQGGERFGSPVI